MLIVLSVFPFTQLAKCHSPTLQNLRPYFHFPIFFYFTNFHEERSLGLELLRDFRWGSSVFSR